VEFCGHTPLMEACSRGHGHLVACLLKYDTVRATIDECERDCGNTSLHTSAKAGHLESTRLLLDAGADPMIQDRCGRTALDLTTNPPCYQLINVCRLID